MYIGNAAAQSMASGGQRVVFHRSSLAGAWLHAENPGSCGSPRQRWRCLDQADDAGTARCLPIGRAEQAIGAGGRSAGCCGRLVEGGGGGGVRGRLVVWRSLAALRGAK
eukprot:COSAG02_NODE_1407_length_12764_cov_3781.882985_1_plen_108_part_10